MPDSFESGIFCLESAVFEATVGCNISFSKNLYVLLIEMLSVWQTHRPQHDVNSSLSFRRKEKSLTIFRDSFSTSATRKKAIYLYQVTH